MRRSFAVKGIIILTALLLAPRAALHAAEAPPIDSHPRLLFRQPVLEDFGNRMYVQARVPFGEFAMVSWQKSPFNPGGNFLPVRWDAGSKTGLLVTGDRTAAQRGMRNVEGATTAQMSGDAVGAYLNSADLSGSGIDAQGRPLPGSDGFNQLKSFHLNAEITFETAPAEMGWSMRRALLTLEE